MDEPACATVTFTLKLCTRGNPPHPQRFDIPRDVLQPPNADTWKCNGHPIVLRTHPSTSATVAEGGADVPTNNELSVRSSCSDRA